MGINKVKESLDSGQRRAFVRALLDDIHALERMEASGLIERDVRRIGAEQEVFLVDAHWQPSPVGPAVFERLPTVGYSGELGVFNLEANVSAQVLAGSCLSRMETELRGLLGRMEEEAAKDDARVLLTGILPTLAREHLTLEWMAPNPRYHRLNQVMTELRGREFVTMIKGLDDFNLRHDNVMLEACNTSFQIHFQVGADEFAKLYNLAQAVTGPVLAAAVNSPVLLQHRLWQETRVALFQQSLDSRSSSHEQRGTRQRVSFGDRWVKRSVLEIFREDVARFRVLLSSELGEPSTEILARGEVPGLDALRLHNGTVYRWNRPCYGLTDGKPHLRIENRVLPAGPAVVDEMANAAFFFGLMIGLGDEVEDVTRVMSFDDAKGNFNAAAQYGLKAHLRWFGGKAWLADELILKQLLPLARRGLESRDIDHGDIDLYLGILQERVASGRTGAQWALESLAGMEGQGTRDERYRALTASISKRQAGGRPVHTWSLAQISDAGNWRDSYRTVRQMMTTDVFTVHADDLVDLAASMMEWEHIRYVPVEDQEGHLMGLVSHRALLRLVGSKRPTDQVAVSEIMTTDPVTVSPDTSALEAIEVMRKHRVGCLPVVENRRLVGILTTADYMEVAAKLLDEQKRKA